MKLKQYNILHISARTILNLARKTKDGWRFCFDTTDETNQALMQKIPQDDCALFHQLLALISLDKEHIRMPDGDELLTHHVVLDFSGIFDRPATGLVKELQEKAELLFRPEGIEIGFFRGLIRFVAFERSASMSRENKLAFICADLYDAMWERMTLGMKIGQCQLSKLYAYNGLMFTSGWAIDEGLFHMDSDHVIVVDNPHSAVKGVPVVTVEDDGSDKPVRKYTRVEKTMDIYVEEFDGEGLVSAELARFLDPYGDKKRDHHSFQIRMPYIKGVVHEVDFHALFRELGVEEIEDIEGVRHPVSRVDMILTKSMCKGWGWMEENGLSWKEYLDRCREYGHLLFVSNTDRRSRDGLTELNFQLLNTAAITAEEYRPQTLPMGWERSPAEEERTWLTKATETAYFNTVANPEWQLSYFTADKDNPELDYSDARQMRALLLYKNPAFLAEKVFQKELEDKAKQIREKYGIGKLQISGDTRYLSDDLMRLLATIVKPTSAPAFYALSREMLKGAELYAPQPSYPQRELLTILRNPHVSRNEEALVKPLSPVGPLREKYLSHLYYVAMVDSRSLIPDRLGGADYDGDTVHLYAEPMLCDSIRRNYDGGLENADNLPLLKIPSAEPVIADAHDWQARLQTVKSTFSSRVGQISNAALRRSILAYDEATPEDLREQYRRETEVLTILTGLEIDSAKSGIKPDLSEYLGKKAKVKSLFLRYKDIAGEPEQHAWYEPTKNKRLRAFFESIEWDEVTANLERTPLYARQLGKETKTIKVQPAESEELFEFALDPNWREKIDPGTLERVRLIIADYEEAKRRCEAYRHLTPSGNYRKDISRILFSRDQEKGLSADELYPYFERYNAHAIRRMLDNLRSSNWMFTRKEDRLLMLFEIFPGIPPDCREILCDFRCGGYRLLGDILMDLDEQKRVQAAAKNKGVHKDDSKQMKRMMRDALDSADYKQTLIKNCRDIVQPSFPTEQDQPIEWFDMLVGAEFLGKRDFILEVMPAIAVNRAINRIPPKKGESFVKRVGRVLGIHRDS